MNDTNSEVKHAKVFWNRPVKIVAWVLGILLVYTFLGFFSLPLRVKGVLEDNVAKAIGRPIRVTNVETNPFTLTVRIFGLKVLDTDESIFASVGEAFVDVEWSSIFTGGAVVRQIQVIKPYAHVVRLDETTFNFSDIIAAKEPAKAEKEEPAAGLFPFVLTNVEIIDGRFEFDDLQAGVNHLVAGFNFTLPALSSLEKDRETPSTLSIVGTYNGAAFNVAGDVLPFAETPAARLTSDLQGLSLPPFLAYSPVPLELKVPSAMFGANTAIEASMPPGAAPQVNVSGKFSLTSLDVRDAHDEPLLQLPLLGINLAPSKLHERDIHIAGISLESPSINVTRLASGAIDWLEALPKPEAVKPEDKPAVEEPKAGTGEPATAEPAKDESATDQPVTDQPVTDQATATDSTANESTTKDSGTEQPATAESTMGESAPKESTTGEQPAVTAGEQTKEGAEPAQQEAATAEPASGEQIVQGESAKEETGPEEAGPDGNGQEAAAQPAVPTLVIEDVTIDGGRVALQDRTPATPFTLVLENFTVTLNHHSGPDMNETNFSLSAAAESGERVSLNGKLNLKPFLLEGEAEMSGAALKRFAPYYQGKIPFAIDSGTAGARASYRVRMAEGGKGGLSEVSVSNAAFDLKGLGLSDPANSEVFLTLDALDVTGTTANLLAQEAVVGKVALNGGKVKARRESSGEISLIRQLTGKSIAPVPAAANDSTTATAAPATTPAPAAGSTAETAPAAGEAPPAGEQSPPAAMPKVTVTQATIANFIIDAEDQVPKTPVPIKVDLVNVTAGNLSMQPGNVSDLSASLKINEKGTVKANGKVSIQPVDADLQVEAQNLDIAFVQAYIGDQIRLEIKEGAVGAKGRVKASVAADGTPAVSYTGEASVNRFHTRDRHLNNDFLKWNSLYLTNIDVNTNPLKAVLGKVALTDFYSRMIINPDGSLNVYDVLGIDKKLFEPGGAKKNPEAASDGKKAAPQAKQTQTAPAPAPAKGEAAKLPDIQIGNLTLQGGNINFSDHFIKPNFEANMEEVGGGITGLNTKPGSMAEVSLAGRLDNRAPLEIKGKLNPFPDTLAVDMGLVFTDIELGPMSPYSRKYLGYNTKKGKLNLTLHYKVADGNLEGRNKIVLDQLTLGEKVDSPDAMKVPLEFAISLLKDSDGKIDLDVPVSGNMNNPQFNIGAVISKAIGNLFTKILTAPFSFLASLVGGGSEDLETVEFEPGMVEIPEEGKAKLAKLAEALVKRPSLTLEIEGQADPSEEVIVLKQQKFEEALWDMKTGGKGKPAPAEGSTEEITIPPAEREQLVIKAFDAAEFAKPRDEKGNLKPLAPEEMEKLLYNNIRVMNSDLKKLADERAAAVKDYLVQEKSIPAQRLFLLESTLKPSEKDETYSRVLFKLD